MPYTGYYLQKLIKRYAGSRKICNCGEAYESPTGVGSVFNKKTGQREDRTDMWQCQGGCSCAKIKAVEHVCKSAMEELKLMDLDGGSK